MDWILHASEISFKILPDWLTSKVKQPSLDYYLFHRQWDKMEIDDIVKCKSMKGIHENMVITQLERITEANWLEIYDYIFLLDILYQIYLVIFRENKWVQVYSNTAQNYLRLHHLWGLHYFIFNRILIIVVSRSVLFVRCIENIVLKAKFLENFLIYLLLLFYILNENKKGISHVN